MKKMRSIFLSVVLTFSVYSLAAICTNESISIKGEQPEFVTTSPANCNEYQTNYNKQIHNIQKVKDSWNAHKGTNGEVVNKKNLQQILRSITTTKNNASKNGCSIQVSKEAQALEKWAREHAN